MKPEDRKLAWAIVIALAVVAAELAWLILVGPPQAETHQQSNQEAYYWIRETLGSAAFWTAIFTGLLVWSTWLLWHSTRQSVRIAERALTDLERPYLFNFGSDRITAAISDGSRVTSYSIVNHGKSPAIIDAVIVILTPTTSGAPPADFEVVEPRFNGWIVPAGGADSASNIIRATANYLGLTTTTTSNEIVPTLSEPEDELFFRLRIQYHGPFTRGHETSICLQYDPNTNRFARWGGEEYNYNR